jgi:diaminopimelate epimerase
MAHDHGPNFSKFSATENDFLILDLEESANEHFWRQTLAKKSVNHLVKELCHRRRGIGADGVLVLEPSSDADWRWDFYNSDGSSAEMCGNAARCCGVWAARKTGEARVFRFLTSAGLVVVRGVSANAFEVSMPQVKLITAGLKLSFSDGTETGQLINSGVPHFVIQEKNLIADEKLKKRASRLRSRVELGERGANITFMEIVSRGDIKTSTFERGVEDFTRSCGTGAVAAAFAHKLESGATNVQVIVPGGTLKIEFKNDQVLLTGPAHFVADCEISLGSDGVLSQ